MYVISRNNMPERRVADLLAFAETRVTVTDCACEHMRDVYMHAEGNEHVETHM